MAYLIDCTPGRIVLAPWSWVDAEGNSAWKLRPSLILSDHVWNRANRKAYAMFITSTPATRPNDFCLDRWAEYGLPMPSTLRGDKFQVFDVDQLHALKALLSVEDEVLQWAQTMVGLPMGLVSQSAVDEAVETALAESAGAREEEGNRLEAMEAAAETMREVLVESTGKTDPQS